jgi:hypothetical protein
MGRVERHAVADVVRAPARGRPRTIEKMRSTTARAEKASLP